MKRRILNRFTQFIIVLVVALCISQTTWAAAKTEVVKQTIILDQSKTRSYLERINQYRAEGLIKNTNEGEVVLGEPSQPLVYDYELEKIAQKRAVERYFYWGNLRPNGKSIESAYDEAGYDYISIAENYDSGQEYYFMPWNLNQYTLPQDEDYANRHAMFNPRFNRVGIARVKIRDEYYWVHAFAQVDENAPEPVEAEPLDDYVVEQEVEISGKLVRAIQVDYGHHTKYVNIGERVNIGKCPVRLLMDSPDVKLRPVDRSVEIDQRIYIEDESVARIEKGKILGLKRGHTFICFDVLGHLDKMHLYVMDPKNPDPDDDLPTCHVTSVKSGLKGLIVNWEPVKGAQNYVIYRYYEWFQSNSYWFMGSVKGNVTSYTDKNLKNGECVGYKVIPVMQHSRGLGEGLFYTYLKRPKISFAENLPEGILIEWSKNDAISSYQTSYLLYRSTNGGKYKKIATCEGADNTYFIDKKAKFLDDVKYKVYTAVGYGDPDKSYASKVVGTVRLTPPEFKLSSNTARVLTVKWTPNSGITRYEISYSKKANMSSAKTVSVSSKKVRA